MLLYAAYFFIGAGIGAATSQSGRAERGWPAGEEQLVVWMIATLVPYGLMWVLIYIKREILGNP